MRKIILDTNFLMIPFQFKVDIFSEIERICNFNYRLEILEGSISELENLAAKAGSKARKAAKMALKLIKLKNIQIVKSGKGYVDELILAAAGTESIVATQDMNLKRHLAQKGVSVIILRQKKYLQLLERALRGY